MKHLLIPLHLIALIICLTGCNNPDNHKSLQNQSDDQHVRASVKNENSINTGNPDMYFYALGSEPFWTLQISPDLIKFKSQTDSVMTPHPEPIRAMDSNVKLYKVNTERAVLDIKIKQGECKNTISGAISPYRVEVDYRFTSDSNMNQVNGCGKYITDYRLHDIWVLEKIGGQEVDMNQYHNGLPMIEINASQNSFLGNTGCNHMNGALFYEREILRFINITTTEKECSELMVKEKEFLKKLSSSTQYKIRDNKLFLSNPDETLLVFKKVD